MKRNADDIDGALVPRKLTFGMEMPKRMKPDDLRPLTQHLMLLKHGGEHRDGAGLVHDSVEDDDGEDQDAT